MTLQKFLFIQAQQLLLITIDDVFFFANVSKIAEKLKVSPQILKSYQLTFV